MEGKDSEMKKRNERQLVNKLLDKLVSWSVGKKKRGVLNEIILL